MTTTSVRGLILDYGEVLCHRPDPRRFEEMAEIAGMDIGAFATRYQQARDPYDRGDLSPAEYWAKVLADSPDESVVDRLRRLDVEIWSDLNADLTGWLVALRGAGLKTAVLSNMHPDMAQHARSEFAWLQNLDFVVLSCELGMIKPSRAIYDHCVEGLGLAPSEACFIDDREVNVRGALEAGLQALRFQTLESLRSDLTEIGVPILP